MTIAAIVRATTIFLVFTSVSPLVAQAPKAGFHKEYLDWCSKFKLYACALQVESVMDAPGRAPTFRDHWFVFAKSDSLGITRFDTKQIANFSPSMANRFAGGTVTTFRSRAKLSQILNGQLVSINLDKEYNQEDIDKFAPQPYFEALSLPLLGFGALQPFPALPVRQEHLQRFASESEEVGDRVTVGQFTKLKVLVNKRVKQFDHIQLDQKFGNQPTVILRGNETGDRVNEKINITWAPFRKDFLPSVLDLEFSMTDSNNKVLVSETWKVKFNWLMDNVPENVFTDDPSKAVNTLELKNLIMEKGLKN